MKNYDYIFFDLDGTLTESGPGIINAVKYSVGFMGIEENRKEVLRSFIGPPLIDNFMLQYGCSREVAVELRRIYQKYYDETGVLENSVFEGVPEMLIRLHEAGKTLVIATSKPGKYVDIVMRHFDLGKYFDFIASSDYDVGRSDKTAVLEYAFDSLGIEDRSRVILVGDRMYDAEGANNVGIDCMGVLYGYGTREELENEGVICIAETVPQIAEMLLS